WTAMVDGCRAQLAARDHTELRAEDGAVADRVDRRLGGGQVVDPAVAVNGVGEPEARAGELSEVVALRVGDARRGAVRVQPLLERGAIEDHGGGAVGAAGVAAVEEPQRIAGERGAL